MEMEPAEIAAEVPSENNDFKGSLELELGKLETRKEVSSSIKCTRDGSLDRHGQPALKVKTGGWRCGTLILANEGLHTLAFAGVEVNLVIFAKLVLRQTNEEASNTFNRWIGANYFFCLVGAFLSDSYLGRYLTCVTFQFILIIGLVALSFSTQLFLLDPHGCGKIGFLCDHHSPAKTTIFYVSIYLMALGYGGQGPALATFGADQFDEEDPKEKRSKISFFSYFYVALNVGSLVSETVLAYAENIGYWVLGFWICASCSIVAYLLLLVGIPRYRHFKPSGNPISRISQVIVASFRKIKLQVPSNGEGLYEVRGIEVESIGSRKILHTNSFRFLDRAAVINPMDMIVLESDRSQTPSPWRLCTITQVEEVKCLLRLLPIWLCTLPSSLLFIQTLSLFVEQGAAMDTTISKFHFPPASMTAFGIVSTSAFIILHDKLVFPLIVKMRKREPKPLSEIRRIGIGLAIGIAALITAGFLEQQRLKYASDNGRETSSLSIFWQAPQYVLLGVAEAFVVVAQMEFFSSQTPDGLKSFGIGLSMSSTAVGSYLSSFILSAVMKITSTGGKPGWVPPNLNQGHLDRYFFLSSAIAAVSLGFYVLCAKRYKSITMEKRQKEPTET